MNKINNLNYFYLLVVLGLGLTGCGSDDQPKSSDGQNWGIQEPVLIREGLSELKLSLAEGQLKKLSTNDILKFHKADLSSGASMLQVKAECMDESGKLYIANTQDRIKEAYFIYEFLTPEILLMPREAAQNEFKCRFDYTVIHKSGSNHRFRTPLSPLSIVNSKNPIKIQNDLDNHTQKIMTSVDANRLDQYLLTENSTISSNYEIHCTDVVSTIQNLKRPLSFKDIVFKNRDSQANKSIKPLNQLCRIFELEKSGRITNISDNFVLGGRPTNLAVEILYDRSKDLNLIFPYHHMAVSISNRDSKPVQVLVPSKFATKIQLTLVMRRMHSRDTNHYGQVANLPLKTTISTPNISPKDTFTLIKVAPAQQVIIQFSYKISEGDCRTLQLIGAINKIDSSEPYLINQLDSISSKNPHPYVAKSWALDLSESRFAPLNINRSAGPSTHQYVKENGLNAPNIHSMLPGECIIH